MAVYFYLQGFEESMRNYSGDDPLDAWDKFVEFLERGLPSEEQGSMCVVLERLVQTFLQDKRYHDDVRYINHCIRCASFHPDPVKLYSMVHGCSVGTRHAALYVSWAEQCERTNQRNQAEQVYMRGLENRAEPLETLQHHYRLFQSRTGKSQSTPSDAVRNPLQNSQLINQQPRQRPQMTLQPQCKEVENALVPADRTVCIISRSDNNPRSGDGDGSRSVGVSCVSMYCVDELVCEGSELSFEELRARRYFSKLRLQELQRLQNEALRRCEEEEEEVVMMKQLLEELNSKLTEEPKDPLTQNLADQSGSLARVLTPQPPSPLTLGAAACASAQAAPRTHSISRESPLPERRDEIRTGEVCVGGVQQQDRLERDVSVHREPDGSVEASYSGLNHSHVTPNTSLGLITATPSRALPSPTVHTREALDLISHMFQVPTLLHDTLFNTTANPADEDCLEKSTTMTDFAPASVNPSSSVPFRIYEDENAEIKSEEQELMKPKPAAPRALMEIQTSKANVTPLGAESLTDDSTIWGARHASVVACPNRTRDFALSAHLVSTPLHPTAPYSWETQLSQEEVAQPFGEPDENPFLRQPAKLSPILEQSPPEEKQPQQGPECTLRGQGTIVGEVTSLPRVDCNQTDTSTISRRSLDLLSLPDQSTSASLSTRPGWSIYQSPNGERETGHGFNVKPDRLDSSTRPGWTIYQSPERPGSGSEIKTTKITTNSRSFLEQDFESDFKAACVISNPDFDSRRLSVFRPPPQSDPSPKPSWSIYQSPERTDSNEIEPDQVFPSSNPQALDPNAEQANLLLPKRSFHQRKSSHHLSVIHQSPELAQNVPMSPAPIPGFGWLQVESPAQIAEPDLDVMVQSPSHTFRPTMSPGPFLERSIRHEVTTVKSVPIQDVAMSPGPDWACPKNPVRQTEPDLDVMMTPCRAATKNVLDDVPMSPVQPGTNPTESVLISDPWDEELILSLLSGLRTPLSSYPNLRVWSFPVPSITPKLSVQMADENLRVDFVLGQGAFATVYQATSLSTSQKLILKVQKPPNPWEFYINAQLNARIEPGARHLYNHLHSAHLFSNGSVLIGEPHTCGTLLNVVNLYKSRSEKLMPQPLVLYFTVCILDMVERLHASHIIHADIKPDNFLLGDRFLENEVFDDQNLDHGLVLIDFGQSIDMSLFPDGTAFTARCMTSGFQCTEMLSGRPWAYQTDYFGVAGTVHCMLFGTYMKVSNEGGVWKSNGVFKRNPHSDVWQLFFHTLLNASDCARLPCLRRLRELLSTALQDNYGSKLRGLKNRLVVQILESKTTRR